MQDTVGLTYWLTHWNWDISLIVGFVLVIGGYLYAAGPLRRTRHLGPPVPLSRGLAFLLGADICFLALFSPLDALADTYLFSAHMLQHMLLSFAGAPLMVFGIPGWLLRSLLRYRPILAIWKILTHPVVTSLLFSANLWLWHAPLLYNATLYNPQLHIICHLLYIATGMLFWWPLLGPAQGAWPPLSLGGKLAYLFFNDMPMVLLGAGLTFMPPLYAPYLHAPRLWGITPALDQQLGGLLMWIVGSIFFIVLASLIFLRWMLQQENADHIPLSTGLDEAERAEQRGSRKPA
jgi:cytochrome c oxidase assembly factor CtaG